MNAQTRGSGPVVWAAVITVTCLLLVVFHAALWLVVPFLVALVIYYGLRPLANRLVLAGLSVETAAAIVSLAFLALLILLLTFLLPWMAMRAVTWQDSVGRYIDGGVALLLQTLAALEERFAFLERVHAAATVRAQVVDFTEQFGQKYATTFAMTLATWLPSALLAPFLAFFMLRDGRRFQHFVSRAVPNAFFERTLYLLYEVDRTAHSYFQGLLKLTVLDAATLAIGLWAIGISSPVTLGLVTAVLAWIPYVGSIAGCLIVVLVAATDFPNQPTLAYSAVGLFLFVRLLDDFLFMPMTVGRSLHIHPLPSVVMLFIGGAIAGVAGLMLVLPLLGVVMAIGETIGQVVTDPRLRARHAYAKRLRASEAAADLSN